MKYLYYVYQKKANEDYSMDDIIYRKLECTQFEVARYVERLNKSMKLLGYEFYFERIKLKEENI